MVISLWGGRVTPSLLAAALGILFLNASAAAASRDIPTNIRPAVEAAISSMRPALVRIQVVSTEYRDGRAIKMQSVGSGAIITRDGYLVTNHHVAGHGTRMICTLWNREEIEAELIGTDAFTDIAVLKLVTPKPRKYDFAVFGDSSKLRVGDSVLAMGSPMALSQSVTLGIISNVEMMMPRRFGRALELDGEDVGRLVKWIGHDAAIYGGNSGGPLVNLRGEIIGINEISFGLSGAIPGNLARAIADELIATRKIRRSWVGLDVQPQFKNVEASRGALVGGVIDDSPASSAGFKAGDLLLEINGQPTNARYDEQMPEVMRIMTGLPIGKEVRARVLRAGEEMDFTVVPIERGELNPKEQELKEWGLTVRDISFLVAKEMKRTNQEGVLVTSVRSGGPSGEAKPSLQTDDVLVQVNDRHVRNTRELIDLTRDLLKGETVPRPVMVTFERHARRYLTVASIGLQELRDPGLELAKAWLPIETHVISREIARQLGDPNLQGFYVTQVYPGTTAAKAGLRAGDFIVALDGEKLTASGPEHEEELATMVRQYDIGATVDLTVLRGKERTRISVELERSPKLRREMKKYRNESFEFTARDISFFDRAEEQWPLDQTGVRVEEVKPGSWAELGTLYVDDLIVEIDGQPTPDVETLKKVMEQIAAEKKLFVVIKVLRGIHTAFLELEPTWKP